MDQETMPLEDRIDLLRKAEIFQAMLEDDLSYLATRVGFASHPGGKAIFKPGSPADRFYIVRSGEVSVIREEKSGHPLEMARFLSGEVFGDFDFAMNGSRNAGAVCSAPTELLVFPMEGLKIEDLAREKPDTVARLMLRSLVMVSTRLRTTHKLISENDPWVRELKRQIFTDPSTGMMSMAFLEEEIPRQLEIPTAVILLKPDKFKELNDAYGHGAGDIAMSLIAEMLFGLIDSIGRGWAVRLRSNESALVVPGCDSVEAEALMVKIANSLRALDLSSIDPDIAFKFSGSFSFGLWPHDEPDFKRLLERANSALLRAWREGGRRAYRLPASGPNGGKASCGGKAACGGEAAS
jgi:diguanylate cyclase (GGDEF)-like protein